MAIPFSSAAFVRVAGRRCLFCPLLARRGPAIGVAFLLRLGGSPGPVLQLYVASGRFSPPVPKCLTFPQLALGNSFTDPFLRSPISP